MRHTYPHMSIHHIDTVLKREGEEGRGGERRREVKEGLCRTRRRTYYRGKELFIPDSNPACTAKLKPCHLETKTICIFKPRFSPNSVTLGGEQSKLACHDNPSIQEALRTTCPPPPLPPARQIRQPQRQPFGMLSVSVTLTNGTEYNSFKSVP